MNRQNRVLLRDVAQKSGVSLSTASMALAGHPQISDETKKYIKLIGHQMGYKSRRIHKTQQQVETQKVGRIKRYGIVILGSRKDDEAYASLLYSFISKASEQDAKIEISSIENTTDEHAVAEKLLENAAQLDALLLTGYVTPHLLAELKIRNVPVLLFGDLFANVKQTCEMYGNITIVKPDDLLGGRLAVSILIAAGHTKIGFIAEYIAEGLSLYQWLSGYKLGHIENELPINSDFIHIAGKPFAGGGPAAQHMMDLNNRPTAYVIPDPRTAASFIIEMKLRNESIDKNSLVIGGLPEMIKKYQLEEVTSITTDPQRTADVAFYQLSELSSRKTPYAIEIIVPFSLTNLSETNSFGNIANSFAPPGK